MNDPITEGLNELREYALDRLWTAEAFAVQLFEYWPSDLSKDPLAAQGQRVQAVERKYLKVRDLLSQCERVRWTWREHLYGRPLELVQIANAGDGPIQVGPSVHITATEAGPGLCQRFAELGREASSDGPHGDEIDDLEAWIEDLLRLLEPYEGAVDVPRLEARITQEWARALKEHQRQQPEAATQPEPAASPQADQAPQADPTAGLPELSFGTDGRPDADLWVVARDVCELGGLEVLTGDQLRIARRPSAGGWTAEGGAVGRDAAGRRWRRWPRPKGNGWTYYWKPDLNPEQPGTS